MPGFTMNETTHRCMVDAVFSRKLRLRNASCGVTSSNFRGLRISQFSKSMLLTLLLAVLGDFISRIVAICAKKQVVRANTRGVVAVMQYAQVFWYSSVVQAIRNAMSKLKRVGFLLDAEDAIAFGVLGCRPIPASGGLFDFCPEAFFKGAYCTGVATSSATKLASSGQDYGAFQGEDCATKLADFLDFTWGYVRMRMHAKLVLSCATPLECSTTRRGIILLISPHYTTSREGFLTWHHHSSQNISRARRHRPRRTRATLPW